MLYIEGNIPSPEAPRSDGVPTHSQISRAYNERRRYLLLVVLRSILASFTLLTTMKVLVWKEIYRRYIHLVIYSFSCGFGLKYKGSRDSGTSGSHGSHSHLLLIFQTESGSRSTDLSAISFTQSIIIWYEEHENC